MDCMFERKEMIPLKEDGSGKERSKSNRGKDSSISHFLFWVFLKQKAPLEVKQQSKDSKGSKSGSEEILGLTKKEMRAEVQRMIVETGSITDCTLIEG